MNKIKTYVTLKDFPFDGRNLKKGSELKLTELEATYLVASKKITLKSEKKSK